MKFNTLRAKLRTLRERYQHNREQADKQIDRWTFYVFAIILAVLLVCAFIATVVTMFHSTDAWLVLSEAIACVALAFALKLFSGD